MNSATEIDRDTILMFRIIDDNVKTITNHLKANSRVSPHMSESIK